MDASSAIGRLQQQAVSNAFDELQACLLIATKNSRLENIDLAAVARDRAAALIIAHDEAICVDLMEGPAGDVYRSVFLDAQLAATLLTLPTSPRRLGETWALLSVGDERRLFAGLLLFTPQDFAGLGAYITIDRWSIILTRYLTWHPKCFSTAAQRERYAIYAIWLCNLCADLIERGPSPPQARMLDYIVTRLHTGTIYSCDGYLVDLAVAKSRLIRGFIRNRFGLVPTEKSTSEVVPADRPIRLGLLWNDAERRTENIVGVASTRDLRRHGFHVTSIVHHRTYYGNGDEGVATISGTLDQISDTVVDLDDRAGLVAKYEAIRALDLDCIIFMSNVTFGYNEYIALATLKLARWQAVNFCAVFTTGFPAVDIYLSGEISERGDDPQNGYTERLVQLPGSCLIFEKKAAVGTLLQRDIAEQLRERGATTLFASGANLYKIHPDLSDAWVRVLAASPGSRLILYPFNPNWDLTYPVGAFTRRLERQLAACGVNPDRITIAGPWQDAGAVTEVLSAVDIYLDSFPHSGGLSSLDALKLGIPVVTRRGMTQRENQSADLLDLMGLSRFVVSDTDGYVALAARLALNITEWAEFRIAISRKIDHASFFDTELYSRGLAEKLKGVLIGD